MWIAALFFPLSPLTVISSCVIISLFSYLLSSVLHSLLLASGTSFTFRVHSLNNCSSFFSSPSPPRGSRLNGEAGGSPLLLFPPFIRYNIILYDVLKDFIHTPFWKIWFSHIGWKNCSFISTILQSLKRKCTLLKLNSNWFLLYGIVPMAMVDWRELPLLGDELSVSTLSQSVEWSLCVLIQDVHSMFWRTIV